MQERRLNAFATLDPRTVGDAVKLGLARDLERRWAGTLVEPIPDDLKQLVDRLEERIRRRCRAVG